MVPSRTLRTMATHVATHVATHGWHTFSNKQLLSISFTLTNGQSFGWVRAEGGVFTGVIGTRLLSFREEEGGGVQVLCHDSASTDAPAPALSSTVVPAVVESPGMKRKRPVEPGMASSPLPPSLVVQSGGPSVGVAAPPATPLELALRDYFQLDVDLAALYAGWSSSDARLASIASKLPGMRVLRQSPWECLASFICSSNNNIPRITQMLDKIRATYGTAVGSVGGRVYYTFPPPAVLAAAPEADLRALGMGYRAKFIKASAAKVVELGGEESLYALRGGSREATRAYLQQLDGVGPKVADCVALFSCDQAGAIPVDTHVWSIACCYYDADGSLGAAKSLTPSVYDRVGSVFRDRFGPHAGWAHCLLFAAELPSYRALLPPELGQDMAAFRVKEKGVKAVKKAEAAARKKARVEGGGGGGGGGSGGGGSSAPDTTRDHVGREEAEEEDDGQADADTG